MGPSIFQATLMEAKQKTPEISTEELRKILADKSATVFDARTFKEYAISHIPGVVIVRGKPGAKAGPQYVSDVDEISYVVKGNKAAPIVLYCSGPFCGKSKRLAEELQAAGFTNVRRYQLGIPVWRALGGITEIELEAIRYVVENDKTAVFLDARDPGELKTSAIPGAKNLPLSEVKKAKEDGRLPVEDHNTRIIVFGRDGSQAKALAEALTKEAFHNVSYFAGTLEALQVALK
jgi:rhodanese-related sulfurtransferase